MATVVRRTFASTPERTASDTWTQIVKLLAPDSNTASHKELLSVSGVAASLISSEAPKEDAIVAYGNGPVVRVYCVFDDAAINKEDVDESPLTKVPTEGDWKVSLPCAEEDLKWTNKKLASLSKKISARACGEAVEYEETKGESKKAASSASINLNEFFK